MFIFCGAVPLFPFVNQRDAIQTLQMMSFHTKTYTCTEVILVLENTLRGKNPLGLTKRDYTCCLYEYLLLQDLKMRNILPSGTFRFPVAGFVFLFLTVDPRLLIPLITDIVSSSPPANNEFL